MNIHAPIQNSKFMLDTCVINRFLDNPDDFKMVLKSLELNFQYFITDVQYDELRKTLPGATSLSNLRQVERTKAERAVALMEIVSRTQSKRLQQIADWWRGFPLDGSVNLPPDDPKFHNLYLKILNYNDKHYEDAKISCVAMINDCILVTADRRVNRITNELYSGQSMMYLDFIRYLSGYLAENSTMRR